MAVFNIQERDLDLIILEELHSNRGFAEWLAELIGYKGARFLHARHSVSVEVNGIWGETDILAFFEYGADKVAVLIEDKIGATFTDRQAERYHERAHQLIADGDASLYKTVLIAPNSYLVALLNPTAWHLRLSLEAIVRWFQGYGDHHAQWRADILSKFLIRFEKGAPDKREALEFSNNFSNYLKCEFPDFYHHPTSDVYYLIIRCKELDGPFEIYWNVNRAVLNLRIYNQFLGHIHKLILPELYSVRSTPKSDIVSLPVGSASWAEPFEQQIDVARGVVAACRMLLPITDRVAALSPKRP